MALLFLMQGPLGAGEGPYPKNSVPYLRGGCVAARMNTNNAPSINTNNTNDQSGGTNVLNIIGPQKLLFDVTIGDQLASKLPTGKSIEIMAVGSRPDWNIADQYAQYLKAKGFAVSFSRTSETVPPVDRKITIRDDPTTSPTVVIIAPSAL